MVVTGGPMDLTKSPPKKRLLLSDSPLKFTLKPPTAMNQSTLSVTAWLPRPGIRTYIFLAGLPVLLSQAMTSYLALYP